MNWQLGEQTVVTCARDQDCPPEFLCRTSIAACVPIQAEDSTAPSLRAPAEVAPRVGTLGTSFTVRFGVSEPLFRDPAVTLDTGLGWIALPVHEPETDRAAGSYAFSYSAEVGALSGARAISITLVDRLGNEAANLPGGAVLLDFEAPKLSESPVLGPSILSHGATATLDLVFTEELTSIPQVGMTLAGRPPSVDELPWTHTTGLGGATHRFSYLTRGDETEGEYTVWVKAQDEAGNESQVILVGGLELDFTPPALQAGNSVRIFPAHATLNDLVVVELDLTEPLAALPELQAGSGTAVHLYTGSLSSSTQLRFTHTVRAGQDGQHDLVLGELADVAGNLAAPLVVGTVVYDTRPPVAVDFWQSSAQLNASQVLEVRFWVSETLREPPVVALGNYPMARFESTGADPYTYLLSLASERLEDELPIRLSLVDEVGNRSPEGFSAGAPVQVDTVPPSLLQVDVSPALARLGSLVRLSVTASEELAREPDLVWAGAAEPGFVHVAGDGSPRRVHDYTLGVDAATPWGSFALSTLDLQDRLGNASRGVVVGRSVVIDNVLPEVRDLATDSARYSAQPGHDVITLSFDASEPPSDPSYRPRAWLGERSLDCDVYAAATPNYLCHYQVDGTEAEGVSLIQVAIEDAAGNEGFGSDLVTLDFTPPRLELITITPEVAAAGSTAILRVAPDEVLVQAPRLTWQGNANPGFTWSGLSGLAHTFVSNVGAGVTPGVYRLVQVELRDVVGHVSTLPVDQTFAVSVEASPVAQLSLSRPAFSAQPGFNEILVEFDLTRPVASLQVGLAGAAFVCAVADSHRSCRHQVSTALAEGLHVITVTTVDQQGNAHQDTLAVRIDHSPPVPVVQHLQPSAAGVGRELVLRLAANEPLGALPQVKALGPQQVELAFAADPGSSTTFRHTVAAYPAEGSYQLAIGLVDALGNASLSPGPGFAIDATPPVLANLLVDRERYSPTPGEDLVTLSFDLSERLDHPGDLLRVELAGQAMTCAGYVEGAGPNIACTYRVTAVDAPGQATLDVLAVDAAGNQARAWTRIDIAPCASGQHDGGDGLCVPLGSCSAGFGDGGDGRCVADGVCLPGYHDGGDGRCVAEGSCTAGFVDGGDGVCRLGGGCVAGFHDGGDGRCVASGTCSPGYTDPGTGCVAATTYSAIGAGTTLDPYLIYHPAQFVDLGLNGCGPTAATACSASIAQRANLDLSSYGGTAVVPIGHQPSGHLFAGRYDGGGHSITALGMARPGTVDQALFGALGASAVLTDLHVVAGSIVGGTRAACLVSRNAGSVLRSSCQASVDGGATATDVGGLVGINQGLVEDCAAEVILKAGTARVGGLVGSNDGGAIVGCHVRGEVTANTANDVGGLVGRHAGRQLEFSWSDAVVRGRNAVGGLAGTSTAELRSAAATGLVSGYDSVGGLVGVNLASVVADSWSASPVIGSYQHVGGLVGTNTGRIERSRAAGPVRGGHWYVGGLTSTNAASGEIVESYASGPVQGGSWYVGGLVGLNSGTIRDSFTQGAVLGDTEFVGGLVGLNNGSVLRGYAAGPVRGAHRVGGLIGSNLGSLRRLLALGSVGGEAPIGIAVGEAHAEGSIEDLFFDAESFVDTGGAITTPNADAGVAAMGGWTAILSMDHPLYAGDEAWDFAGTWILPDDGGLPRLRWDHRNPEVGFGPAWLQPRRVGFRDRAAFSVAGYCDRDGQVLDVDAGPAALTGGPVICHGGRFTTTLDFAAVVDGTYTVEVSQAGGGSAALRLQKDTSLCDATLGAPFDSGDGVTAPFVICTLEQLEEIAVLIAQVGDRHFVLGDHIDARPTALPGYMQGRGFTPIGDAQRPFSGILDGRGFELTGLTIRRPEDGDVGLFGQLGAGAQVRELTLREVRVVGGSRTGALAGTAEEVALRRVGVQGYVRGTDDVGGLAGVFSGQVRESAFQGVVAGFNQVGGLLAVAQDSALERVAVDAWVRGIGLPAGGLVGTLVESSLRDARVQVVLWSAALDGGLAGQQLASALEACAVTGQVTSVFGTAGGLVGQSIDGSLRASTARVSVLALGGGASTHGPVLGDVQGGLFEALYYDALATTYNLGGAAPTDHGVIATAVRAPDLVPAPQLRDPAVAPLDAWDFVRTWQLSEAGDPELRW